MRASRIAQATRRVIKKNPQRDVAGQMMPPLRLYRELLRSHRRHLPADQRLIGDMYVKQEFRLHKNIDNPAQIVQFLSSWQKYLEQISGDSWRQQKLDMDKINSMTDEQIIQLYELMQAARGEESEYGDILKDKPSTETKPEADRAA